MHVVDPVLGQSAAMEEVRDLIRRVADSPSNVLITGERGTGKELVAKVIHNSSNRRTASFVTVNCSATPQAILENELFGRNQEASPGTGGAKRTLFEEAHEGTLFLDEIGELPLLLQAQLVRRIEDKEAHRATAAKSIIVDVRFIAATSVNLANEVKAQRFRDDLYYRLNVVEIGLPPLRDRVDDIPILAEAFLKRYSGEYSKAVRGISEAALYLLMNYSWPGNVRELESALERAVTLSQGSLILPEDLPASIQQTGSRRGILSKGVERDMTLEQVEQEYIRLILDKTGGNKYQTAEILGIDRKTLYRKIAEMDKAGRP
jgi:DNA-binding NtrC family response regulator